MVDDGNFPIKVFFRDRTSHSLLHPGFTLWSRHKSGAAADRAYRELVHDVSNEVVSLSGILPGQNSWPKDVEIVDVRTGERKRFGSAAWRRGHAWTEPFKLDEPPCAELVASSGVVSSMSNVAIEGDDVRNMYGCLPCPSCGGKHRASYVRVEKRTVECDDCGYVEPGKLADEG